METNLEFNSWVPKKMIAIPLALSAVFSGCAFIHWAFLVPGVLLLICGVYMAVMRKKFSTKGENIQGQVQNLVVEHIEWSGNGKVLDIGCGNGPLSIKIAQKFPSAQITAIDYWGKGWDYSQKECEANAKAAKIADRITFQHASASKLPFDDDSFDLVVSNLTFHEVNDTPSKLTALQEAMRVLKPGGTFVLQDLFLLKPYFGTPEELTAAVRSWGVSDVDFIVTRDAPFIPRGAKLGFMLGGLSMLKGKK